MILILLPLRLRASLIVFRVFSIRKHLPYPWPSPSVFVPVEASLVPFRRVDFYETTDHEQVIILDNRKEKQKTKGVRNENGTLRRRYLVGKAKRS